MKRRGFLGFMGGAAVAGPGMVRQAAAQSISDLNVAAPNWSGDVIQGVGQSTGKDWARKNLASIMMRTAEQHALFKRRHHVVALDPDLANYRSFSLSAKISIQRERDYWRALERERGWLEASIAGWFDDEGKAA